MAEIQLRKFNMNEIDDDKVVVLIGKRDTGKSFLCKDLLYHKQHIPVGQVISGTEAANSFYSSIVPKLFIHGEFKKEIIANILKKSDKTYKDIGFLGVAYGPGIGDTRFSPVQNLYNYMEKDFNITCHDPYVKYWEELEIQPYQDIKNFLSNNFDCIVITTGHNEYIQSNLFYNELMDSKNNGTLIIDTIGLLDIKKLSPVYELGKNFFILGVGN